MKAGKEKTKCLLDKAGKGSVRALVQFHVKGIKYDSQAQEPLIKDCEGEKSCLLDRGKGSVHVKIKR